MKNVEQYVNRIQTAFVSTMQKLEPELSNCIEEGKITKTQFFILNFLTKEGKCKVSRLAEKMDVKPSAVTSMVDRMIEHGLVIREHSEKDRRVVMVTVTEEGKQKVQEIGDKRKQIIGHYLSFLSEEELEYMASIYEKLAYIVNK
jgi:DNA-binding MarR family transcriptional regulator